MTPAEFPLGLKQILLSGGVVLILLILLSVYSIALIWEKWNSFKAATFNLQSFLQKIRQSLQVSGPSAALELCKGQRSLATSVLGYAFQEGTWEERMRAVDRAIERHEARLEKNLSILGTIGSTSPYIGLFGTVIGVIRAFHAIGGQSAGAGAVAAGIAEALVNTAMGLLVAIPAVIAYNHFNDRLNRLTEDLRSTAEEIIDAIAVKSRRG